MKAAIDKFQPFKAPGPNGLYPVLLQKGWTSMPETQLCAYGMERRHGYIPPQTRKGSYFEAKSFLMITLTSF